MGTASPDKTNRKRTRSKALEESLNNQQTSQEKEVILETTPEQKPAKKRRKSKQNDSLIEDTPKIAKSQKKKQSPVSDVTVPETKSKKTKRKIANDSVVDENPRNNDESNVSLSKTSKSKKTGEKNKQSKVMEKETKHVDDIENDKSAVKKKKKKKDKEETKQVEDIEKDKSAVKKTKKKKGKKASTFGVVDSNLLVKSGGDNDANDESKPSAPSRINRAVDYLHLWKTSRKSWKFNKNFQSMLIKAIYNPVIIPEDDFDTMLLYLEEVKGNAREKLKTDAMALIKESDDHLAETIDADMEKRARAILQMLG